MNRTNSTKRIISRNLDERHNHYIALKKHTRKKSKAEKIVLLSFLNVCIYAFLFPVFASLLNSTQVVTIYMQPVHADTEILEVQKVQEVQNNENALCGLDIVECANESELIENMITRAFPESPQIALAIAKAESGLNTHAINRANSNGSTDCGLFQINSIHTPTSEQCHNAAENIAMARKIYDARGDWSAWSAYNNGTYKKHINAQK